jgi:hypothetical protein
MFWVDDDYNDDDDDEKDMRFPYQFLTKRHP